MNKPVGIPELMRMKGSGEKIVMVTAYNHWQMRLAEESGADTVLVGDSLGMVEHGLPDTLGVTMEMMTLHCRAVMRARKRAFVVGDLPFMSYEIDEKEAVRNAGALVKSTGVDAVKLEGGAKRASTVRAIVTAGVAVVGHIGLTPQTATQLGGYRVQGRDPAGAACLLRDAVAIEEAGACALVLECVPSEVAAFVSRRLSIPTIGIGAGPDCDGQVLVFHDIVTLYGEFKPKFVKRFSDGGGSILDGLLSFAKEVREGGFPAAEHSFKADGGTLGHLETLSE
ncbi:MAG: 3-methyl-2-oxobutanoate hydroxymethyltransferase [Thermovirgaceae bacterium]|nr:3-methyl-2-oxobutanoate hydroxymethyltransferase [Thermovirgaceae bacterium]